MRSTKTGKSGRLLVLVSVSVVRARSTGLEGLKKTERVVLNLAQSHRLAKALLAKPTPPTKRMLAAMRRSRTTVKSDLDAL